MSTVHGTLFDCSLGHLVGKHPELVFTLSDPATSGSGVYLTDPIRVTPADNGVFYASLAPTETMFEDRWYSLQARWLDEFGGMSRVDYPDWQIRVPVGGGSLGALVPAHSKNPMMVFYQSTLPDSWRVGQVWVNTATWDLNMKEA